MVQDSYLYDDYAAREEEELRRLQLQAPPPPPPQGYGPPPEPVSLGAMAGQQALPPVTPPPEVTAAGEMQAMNTFGAVLPQMRDLQAGLQVAGEFPIPQGQTPYNLTPAGLEDVQAPQGSLRAQLLGQPETQGYVATVPTDYTESPLTTGLKVAAGPMQVYQGLNVEVPYVSPALREAVPFLVNNASTLTTAPINIASQALGGPDISPPAVISSLTGTPNPGQTVSNFYGDRYGALDIASIVAPGIGDVPVDDIVRGVVSARGYADNVVRGALPEPSLLPGYSAGPNPYNFERAMEFYRAQGVPEADLAAFAQSMNASPPGTIENASDAARRAARDAYVNAPEGQQLAASRQAAASTYDNIVNQGLSPAEADELRIAQEIADEDAAYARTLTGGGTPGPLPAEAPGRADLPSPPPASAFEPPLTTGAGGAAPAPILGNASPLNAITPSAAPPPPAPVLGNATPLNLSDPANMAARRGPIEVPATFPMTNDEAIVAAQQIGFPIDTEVLARGSALAKSQEMGMLSAAIDFDNFKKGYSTESSAFENFVRMERERLAGGAGGGAGGGRPPTGDYPKGVDTPQSRSLWDRVMEASYLPLSGDVGTLLRQDLTRTANPIRAGETREVLSYMVRAGSGAQEATKIADELDGIVKRWETQYGYKLNLADWQGKNLTNRETMQSALTNNIPIWGDLNRMNATELNARRVVAVQHFIDAHGAKLKPAEVGDYMRYVERVTGRGNVPFEEVLGKLGPLFTSMRFALSIPERVPYVIPMRLVDGKVTFGDRVWREAVKDHAGFAATLAGTLYMAQQAGLDVDFDKGSIKVGQTTYNLTGGVSGYWNTIQKMADGDLMAGVDFTRNKIGPVVQLPIQGLQVTGADRALGIKGATDYLRPDWFNRGATGSGEGWDRALALAMPLWLQDVAKAVRFAQDGNSLTAGLVTAPLSLFGISSSSYEANPRTVENNRIMGNPSNLANLPPNVAEFLQGKEWNAATPQEQKTILANLAPEQRAAIEEAERILRERKDIFQLNRDETKARYDLAAENRAKLQPLAEQLHADWKAGRIPAQEAIDKMKRLEAAADREAGFTRNIGPKISESNAYQEAVKGFDKEKTAEQKEVDLLRELEQKWHAIRDDPRVKLADGKIDWDKVEAAQKALLDYARQKDPGFATRLEWNLQKDPANDFDFTKELAAIDRKLDELGYYAQPQGTKTQYARTHPDVDALLSYKNGWPVHSQQAGAILLRLAPEREVKYAK